MKNGITEVAGKFYQKCKVVMLPVEQNYFKIGDVIKHPEKNPVEIVKTENKLAHKKDLESGVKVYHLYLLSDEEIKVDDWAYGMDGIFQYKGKVNIPDIELPKKIIATTDGSLKVDVLSSFHDGFKKELPRPSNEFLQAYCKANGKIDEVLVEVGNVSGNSIPNYKLKVSPDNTITIKPVKETYTKGEVEKKIFEFNKWRKGVGILGQSEPAKIVEWIQENI